MADIEFPAVMRRVTYSTENCGACMLNKQSKLPLYGRGGKKILIVFEKQEAINQTSKTYAVGSKFDFVKDFLEEFKFKNTLELYCNVGIKTLNSFIFIIPHKQWLN